MTLPRRNHQRKPDRDAHGDEPKMDRPELHRKVLAAIHELLPLLASETEETPSPAAPFVDRCPSWLEERTYRAALVALAKAGKVFRPGRRQIVRISDLISWVEAHPVDRTEPAANDASPVDHDSYEAVARDLRRRAR